MFPVSQRTREVANPRAARWLRAGGARVASVTGAQHARITPRCAGGGCLARGASCWAGGTSGTGLGEELCSKHAADRTPPVLVRQEGRGAAGDYERVRPSGLRPPAVSFCCRG